VFFIHYVLSSSKITDWIGGKAIHVWNFTETISYYAIIYPKSHYDKLEVFILLT